MSDVSIIICTRNRIEDLTRCIQSIAGQQQLEHTAVELLIVDDGDISDQQVELYRDMVSGLPQGVLKYHKKVVPAFGYPAMKRCLSYGMISCCILTMMPNWMINSISGACSIPMIRMKRLWVLEGLQRDYIRAGQGSCWAF